MSQARISEPLSTWSAIAAMAALTWKRTRRSRTLIISLVLMLLPAAVGVAMRFSELPPEQVWSNLLRTELVLLAVLCPLYAAASLGDEIESGTMTYLWSRPMPRWTIAAGKLVALTPIVALMLVGSVTLAMLVARSAMPPTAGLEALALGAVTVSIAATGIAMLVPRHSMVVPMAYVLFLDLPIGELPAVICRLSMTHHLRAIGEGTATGENLVWLLGVTAVWAALGLWRLRKFE
jgi:ABC-2 type transport system permease protein